MRRCFSYAAWADKYDGAVHHTPLRNVTLAMPEPIGVIGMVCARRGAAAGVPVADAAGDRDGESRRGGSVGDGAVARDRSLPGVRHVSDLPGGVVNIVTGLRKELLTPLAGHDDVDAIWVFGHAAEAAEAEKLSAGNMKRTWTEWTVREWHDRSRRARGRSILRQATQVKNIWVPYGA